MSLMRESSAGTDVNIYKIKVFNCCHIIGLHAALENIMMYHDTQTCSETDTNCIQGSFPAGTPENGVPKLILTVGTAFKPALGEL